MISLTRRLLFVLVALLVSAGVRAAEPEPVSFHRDVTPILKKACTGCHHPGKLKGKLDLTTHGAFLKGGKEGPSLKPGHPEQSLVIDLIVGPVPDMPPKGDPLTEAEVDLIARWIRQGAKDDTPAESTEPLEPPTYEKPPTIADIEFSPDGKLLAVTGYHEVLLHEMGGEDGPRLVARLVGAAPRVESLEFSQNGKLLAVSGGAPARWGHVQIWDVEKQQPLMTKKVSSDSLYGISFSPEADKVAFGGADKITRMMTVPQGEILMEFKNHADWVFATTFTAKGDRLVSGSRDKAMKLINVENARFIDDINNPLEEVFAFARHPKEDVIVYGGDLGEPRIYNISDNQKRTAARRDTNLVRKLERHPGAVYAVAYSPDGKLIATGCITGEVRLYNAADGKRLAILSGHEGPVFAVAFHPDGKTLATAGYDGKIRLYETPGGKLLKTFVPVPLQ